MTKLLRKSNLALKVGQVEGAWQGSIHCRVASGWCIQAGNGDGTGLYEDEPGDVLSAGSIATGEVNWTGWRECRRWAGQVGMDGCWCLVGC